AGGYGPVGDHDFDLHAAGAAAHPGTDPDARRTVHACGRCRYGPDDREDRAAAGDRRVGGTGAALPAGEPHPAGPALDLGDRDLAGGGRGGGQQRRTARGRRTAGAPGRGAAQRPGLPARLRRRAPTAPAGAVGPYAFHRGRHAELGPGGRAGHAVLLPRGRTTGGGVLHLAQPLRCDAGRCLSAHEGLRGTTAGLRRVAVPKLSYPPHDTVSTNRAYPVILGDPRSVASTIMWRRAPEVASIGMHARAQVGVSSRGAMSVEAFSSTYTRRRTSSPSGSVTEKVVSTVSPGTTDRSSSPHTSTRGAWFASAYSGVIVHLSRAAKSR